MAFKTPLKELLAGHLDNPHGPHSPKGLGVPYLS